MKLAILFVGLYFGFGIVVISQPVYLEQSIDPNILEPPILVSHLDTSSVFRTKIPLVLFTEEFANDKRIKVETFYQKSSDHLLLSFGSIEVYLNHTYVESGGMGTTYLRLSDGVCYIIFRNSKTPKEIEPSQDILHRSCSQ